MDKKYSPWAILILVTIVLAFLPSFGDRYALFIAYFLVLNVAFAQSWNLVGGYTGLISLGHAAFLASAPMPQQSASSLSSYPWSPALSLVGWPVQRSPF